MKVLFILIFLYVSDASAYFFKETVDPITDEVTAAAKFSSQDNESNFVYACENGNPRIIVAFDDETHTANPLANVIFRFDKNPPKQVSYATMVLTNPELDELVSHYNIMQDLTKSDLLAVRMNTFAAALFGLAEDPGSKTGVFDIKGISQAVKRVNGAAGCPQISEYPKLISLMELSVEKAKEKEFKEQQQAEDTTAEKQIIMAAIQQKVDRNWLRPPGTPQNLSCEVKVRLGANGSVLQVSIIKSSGDLGFDRSVESAVSKASPFPMPTSPRLVSQFRDIRFVFKPSD